MMKKFLRSVTTGLAGIAHAIRSEANMRYHCAAAVAVVAAGLLLGLAAWEWAAVLLCVGVVLSSECMNTALERLADRVTLERDPLVKQAKDCASGAVLLLATTSAVVGVVVFLPKLRAVAGW